MSDSQHRAPLSTRLVLGAIIIAIGVLFLLGNLGWVDARWLVGALWPLALVVVGVGMLRDPRQRKGNPWPWVIITVCVWIFADNMDWIAVNVWDLIVPAILVYIGANLIYRSGGKSHSSKHEASGSENPDAVSNAAPSQSENVREQLRLPHAEKAPEFIRSFAFMSYCDLHPVMQPVRGGDLSAVLGGIKLDLRDSSLEGDEAVLDVFTFWGGIEILVPPDWTISNKVTTLIGGFVDSRRPTKVIPTKTLVIRGFNLMSGIEVKN